MSDNIFENNVYSHKKQMWHKKGTVGQEQETAEQVYGWMKEVIFEKHPATFNVRGHVIPNKVNGIFRIEGDKVSLIGDAKEVYKLRQPIEYIKEWDTMKQYCETLGFLGANAEKMFISWNLPEIDIHGDPIELYGMTLFGFDGKMGNKLFVVAERPVCANTVAMAIGDAEKTNNHGRGKNSDNAVVTTKHTSESHVETMGYWMRYVQSESERQVEQIRSLFCKFEETPVSIDEAYGLFDKVYSNRAREEKTFIPPELKSKQDGQLLTQKEKIQENVNLAMSLFQGAGIGINGKTVYDCLNSVTEHMNHHVMAKKNDGTDSILIGRRGLVMNDAVSIFSQYVTVR
jgi:hypothetical protein